MVHDQPRFLFNKLRSEIQKRSKSPIVTTSSSNGDSAHTVNQSLTVAVAAGSAHSIVTVQPGSAVDSSFLTNDSIYFSEASIPDAEFMVKERSISDSATGVTRRVDYLMYQQATGASAQWEAVDSVDFLNTTA